MQIEELVTTVRAEARDKVDIQALTDEVTFVDLDTAGAFDRLVWESPTGRRTMNFTNDSRRQFFRLLSGPDKYLGTVCDGQMRTINVTYLMNRYGEANRHLNIRCRGEAENLVIRAVLNPSVARYDNGDVVNALLEGMQNHHMTIAAASVSDDMQFTALFPDTTTVGDHTYQHGFLITSSEIHNTTIEAWGILLNTTNRALIRYPIEGGAALNLDYAEMQPAATTRILDTLPSTVYASLEDVSASLTTAAETPLEQVPLILYLLMQKAGVDTYYQQVLRQAEFYAGDGQITLLHVVQAMGRVGLMNDAKKLTILAGRVLTDIEMWDVLYVIPQDQPEAIEA